MVAQLIGQIGKGKGAKFASIQYRAKGTGELAKYFVILGASTVKLYEKDIAQLEEMIPNLEGIELEAATAILASRRQSLEKGIGNNDAYTNKNTYIHVDIPGIKIHKETGAIYVTALVEDKTVIEPGEYKKVNSRPLTIAKRKIEKELPSGRFRQFILPNVTVARLNGEVLELA